MKTWLVRDVMTRNVATVRADATYREIVDLLSERGISALPVVDDAGRVLGVVSEADLLYKIEAGGEPTERRLFEGRRQRAIRVKTQGTSAQELMTSPAQTIPESHAVPEAARIMERGNVKRLPVVDDNGVLVGLVSRADLLRVHLRSDADLKQEVVDEVLVGVLWLDPSQVQVSVNDGVVTLAGQLDRKSVGDLAERLIHGVAGVVDVINELRYDFDDTELTEKDYRSHPFTSDSSRHPDRYHPFKGESY